MTILTVIKSLYISVNFTFFPKFDDSAFYLESYVSSLMEQILDKKFKYGATSSIKRKFLKGKKKFKY